MEVFTMNLAKSLWKQSMRCKLVAISLFLLSPAWASEAEIKSIKVEKLSLNPADPLWQKTPATQIHLSKQNMVTPHGGGSVNSLEVKSLHTKSEIAFLLRWKDETKNATWDVSAKFTDACALQFPLKLTNGRIPSPFMGEKDNPVNIWRWMAVAETKDKSRFPEAYSDFYRQDAIETMVSFPKETAENLIASGFGTVAREPQQDIEASGKWEKSYWGVVLKRKLSSSAGASFKENSSMPVSFAVWDGSRNERDGMKSVGFWQWLVVGQAQVKIGKTATERGKTVFARYGCATCHGPEGKGGVANPNVKGGKVPPLDKVAEGFSEDEIKKVIRDGRIPEREDLNAPYPPLWMNAWKTVLDDNELANLIQYLFSLLPKEKKEEW